MVHPADLGQIPMVEGDIGLNAGNEQRVEDVVVEVDAGLIRLAVPVGEDARPRDGHAEARDVHLAHGRDVVHVAVVEVIRHRTCAGAVRHLSGRVCYALPNQTPPTKIPLLGIHGKEVAGMQAIMV